jgi:segregation and condensation protein A
VAMAISNFESKVDCKTKLSNLDFDGPMDLLLYLIKQAEIDVKDIFVSEVTNQFLEYVNTHDIDMETESEYLSIAATIIEIKSHAIIPNEEAQIEAEEERLSFINRVEEYRLYKESAEKLKNLEDINKFYKKPDSNAHNVKIVYTDFNLDGLINAFANLLKRVDIRDTVENKEKEIPMEVFTVADKIQFIRNVLEERKELSFFDLFTRYSTKNEMITTFQALLELLKHQYLKFEQDETFGDITLFYNENGGEDIGELAEYN